MGKTLRKPIVEAFAQLSQSKGSNDKKPLFPKDSKSKVNSGILCIGTIPPKGPPICNAFISDLEVATFADSKRWKIAQDDNIFTVTLQDVLIIESNFSFLNVTGGEIPASFIGHRRVMNALVIPFAVCDVRESVDGLNWNIGKVADKRWACF